MKLVLMLVVVLIMLTVAYHFEDVLVKREDWAAPAIIPDASPWNYKEEIDPVTKKQKARTEALLKTKSSIGESVIADVEWNCSSGTFDSLKVEITTFRDEKGSDGQYKQLTQDENRAVDYRFDGVASSIATKEFLSGATIRREYTNSVQLFLIAKTGMYGRSRYPGLYVATGRDADNDASYDTKAFYIIDPEFVARIPTTGGTNVVIQFSLEDPAIKKMLTQCGLIYGPVPAKAAKSRDGNGAGKRGGGEEGNSKPKNSSRQAPSTIRTNIRMDPDHPLKLGREYYPDVSLKSGEEGRCVVKVTVSAEGLISNESLESSTGYPRLDEACMTALRGQRVIPATENGKPVERAVSIPIVWSMHAN